MHPFALRCATAGVAALAVGLHVRAGWAAPPRRGNQNPQEGPIVIQSDTAGDAAAAGRARMARGDCAGAIDAFDAAMRSSIDVTIRRDRGLCHEKLGHPYPAMDDYRAYLTARPNAPDADDIHARLMRLSGQSDEGGGAKAAEEEKPSGGGGYASGSMSVSAGTSGGTSSASAEASSSGTTTPADTKGKSLDQIEEEELLDQDAKNSPLRRGTGFSIGPYFQYRQWGLSGTTVGSGYGIGGSLRESISQVSTFLLELGYVRYGSTGSASSPSLNISFNSQVQGFGGTVAYEARIRLDPRTTNAITGCGGLELDAMSFPQNSYTFTTLMARARVGFRHVFGPSLGFEVAGDFAYPFFGSGSILDQGVTSSSWQMPIVGVYVALMVGF